jgi:hypothetical protein
MTNQHGSQLGMCIRGLGRVKALLKGGNSQILSLQDQQVDGVPAIRYTRRNRAIVFV